MSRSTRRARGASRGLVILMSLGLASCSGSGGPVTPIPPFPPPPHDVGAFVRSQSLPDVRSVTTVLSLTTDDGLLFFASYGQPHDCPAGCFYSRAYGLRFGGRIGWIRIHDYEGLDVASRTYFDVQAGDTGLFSDATWNRVSAYDTGFLWGDWFPWLAADFDTPNEAALRMADLLSGWISPHVATLLLERGVALDETGLLQVLACLPVFQGDAYADVREQARAALGDAFVPCAPQPRA